MTSFYNEIKKFHIIEIRDDVITKYTKNKDVLDLGCAGPFEDKDYFLHGKIEKSAKTLIGIDINAKRVLELRKKGYNVIQGNVENFDLKKKFDVIIASELIEHVDNQGLFLNMVKKHLKKGGVFIVSTPNCTSISNFLEVLLFGTIILFNEDHKFWHNYSSLKLLLKKYNFNIFEGYYILCKDYKYYKNKSGIFTKNSKLVFFIRYLIMKFFISLRKDFSPYFMCICKLD